MARVQFLLFSLLFLVGIACSLSSPAYAKTLPPKTLPTKPVTARPVKRELVIPVKVLIGFKQTPGAKESALVQRLGGTIKYQYHLVPAIAAQVPSTAVSTLRSDPSVTVVEPDLHALKKMDTATSSDWGIIAIHATSTQSNHIIGSGVSVAVIDSGIDYTHPALRAAYSGGYNFIKGNTDPFDDNGHGTHVSGIIAGQHQPNGAGGVAPGVRLYALKVLDAAGTGYFSDIIAALEWSVDHHMQLTNNSYGTLNDPGTIVAAAFVNAYKADVLSFAAAGNSGSCTGSGARTEYPGRYDSVVAVAAVDQGGKHACFSSAGPQVDISAPGVNIVSTKAGGGYVALSGTSMATPFATGVAALVISTGAIDKNGTMRVNEAVRMLLNDAADDLGAPGPDNLYGSGLVNAEQSVAKALAKQVIPHPS